MPIDFQSKKQEAIAIASHILQLEDSTQYPKAYSVGKVMFAGAMQMYMTAVNTERTTSELVEGWSCYFSLNMLRDNKHFGEWQEFADKWFERYDNFLPPIRGPLSKYASCQNLLDAVLSFSWNISLFAKDSFKTIGDPKPQQKATTFLLKINKAFDNLALALIKVYDAIVTDEYTKKCEELLEIELGRYQRQLKRQGEQDQVKYDFDNIHLKEKEIDFLYWFYEKGPIILLPKKYSKLHNETKYKYANKFVKIGFLEKPKDEAQGLFITEKGQRYIEKKFLNPP